jgi:hypothetical protein
VLYEYDESAEDCMGKELGRLDNAIEVTITGEAVDYTMSFTAPADGQYQITLDNVPSIGDTYLTRWNRGKSNYSSIYVSDGTQTYTETTFMGALQDGDIYDLRLLTTYTLEEQTIKAVMTPVSKKTYEDYATKNIQFSKYNNSIYCISWDGIDATGPSGNYYKVMATQDDGETWELIGTAYYEKKWPLFDESAVSYNGVKVITVVNGEEVAETEALDLSITVLEDTDSDSVVAGFTANGDNSMQADLSGLTPNTYFYMHLATTLDPLSSQRLYSTTADEQGTCTTTFTNATIIERITNGYYLVKEFRDYNLSADGKAISYTAVTRGDWTKCISE